MSEKISQMTEGGNLRSTDRVPALRVGNLNRKTYAPAYDNDAFVVVRTTNSATANGTALLAAITAAKLLTPNGSDIDVNNRATVVLPPGNYDIGSTDLVLDTLGLNLVALVPDHKTVLLFSDNPVSIEASYVLIRGISFRPRGDDTTPALIIQDGLSQVDLIGVEPWPPGDGMELQIGDGTGFASGRMIDSRFSFDLVEGTYTNAQSIDNIQIGTHAPQRAFFAQLTGKATLVTSLLCRPDNSTADAAAISKIAMCFATLDFGSISAGGHAELTIACAGLTSGDHRSACKVGFVAAGPEAGLIFDAWVSATNQVTVRATNITGSSIDPASADYSVIVFKANPPS